MDLLKPASLGFPLELAEIPRRLRACQDAVVERYHLTVKTKRFRTLHCRLNSWTDLPQIDRGITIAAMVCARTKLHGLEQEGTLVAVSRTA
eukprot:4853388-Pyramimonas_sp.AAC.1